MLIQTPNLKIFKNDRRSPKDQEYISIAWEIIKLNEIKSCGKNILVFRFENITKRTSK